MRGVVVASITGGKSPAAVAGFKLGDVITAVNGIKVETLMDFYRALNAIGGKGATFAITRDGNEITLGL